MPFRDRLSYTFPCASPYGEKSVNTLPDGKCVSHLVLKKEPLPPCDNFDLSKIIKAGLPLEKVSTIINGVRSVPLQLEENKNINPDSEED
jgi:hypothetical protein